MKKDKAIISIAISIIIALIGGTVGFFAIQYFSTEKVTVGENIKEEFLEQNEEEILGATTVLYPFQGGTGITSYTTGDLLYATSTSALVKLGIGSTDEVLTVVGGIPDWATVIPGLWTDDGDFTYLTATGDDVVIGASTTSTAPLWLDVSEELLTVTNIASTTFTDTVSGVTPTESDHLATK